ncbi:DUF6438 domain-containing protein [Flavobacterium aquicola]|uniref:DUF6438 domain-containing protein n=1 Tax=Flavobacterium aquicola TaxID=1682742 RepID=A0A3E0E5G2_9FLAO|nr:DUF6438 domain-containing protein [Flavobacterium aquicola]REG92206.1 hypothetical protein C8P67_11548 [Flavobacterium aquicola]
MKVTTLFLLIITLISCNSKSNKYDELILGDWIEVLEKVQTQRNENGIKLPPKLNRNTVLGYSFAKKGIVENKLGYFDRSRKDKDGRTKTKFLGTTTKYKIENDSLKTYNLIDKKWFNAKILKLTKDTLILEYKDKSKDKFIRKKYKTDNIKSFDKIIISTSGCYGFCPVRDIIISKSGEIFYYGKMYVDKKGFFKSKISTKDFLKIENDFKKANYMNLKDEYIASHTDDMTITVTFVKNDQILKTITDYGNESPTELKWAVLPTLFLDQQIKLEQINNSKVYMDFGYCNFIDGNQLIELTKSECFYLKILLLSCREVKKDFKSKYIIHYWENETEKKMKTDGQYFKFEIEKGKFIILDLGYNFLDKNNLLKRIRKKNEYDF